MLENSLAVQWLGLRTFIAEGPCSIPGGGTKEEPLKQQGGQKKKNEGMLEKSPPCKPTSHSVGPAGRENWLELSQPLLAL